jgi:hypothetical protein
VPEPELPGEVRATGGTLRVAPQQAEVALGARVQIAIENVGKTAFRYHHPGGSSGCDGFSWGVVLVDAQGKSYVNNYEAPDRLCTAVMIPPSWIVIEPGKAAPVAIDTGTVWYRRGPSALQKPEAHELSPGSYEVLVQTPTGALRGKLRILPKAASGTPHPYAR